jgi:hypothetical protein
MRRKLNKVSSRLVRFFNQSCLKFDLISASLRAVGGLRTLFDWIQQLTSCVSHIDSLGFSHLKLGGLTHNIRIYELSLTLFPVFGLFVPAIIEGAQVILDYTITALDSNELVSCSAVLCVWFYHRVALLVVRSWD